jgi:hypothetical protein
MRIDELRQEAPDWAWGAERYGFGWRYIGTKDGQRRSVSAVSRICGEDDFFTEWRVDDGITSMSYAMWRLQQP